MWGNVENAAIYSQLSGLPIWFVCIFYCILSSHQCICFRFLMGGCGGTPLNVCQTRHIVRKSYGIGGNDVMDDCVWPLVFTGILSCWGWLFLFFLIGLILNLYIFVAPCWFYKELARMRAEIAHRGLVIFIQRPIF